MAKFDYRVQDQEGKQWKGLVEAPSETKALHVLGQHHYEVLFLKEHRQKWNLEALLAVTQKVRPTHFNFFVRQLATLLESGIPLLKGIRVLRSEMQDARLSGVTEKVAVAMEKGCSFSEAIARQPQVFDSLFVSMARAGEASGELDTVLLRLAQLMERDAQTRAKVNSALRYPVFAFSVMTGAFLVSTLFIIPRFRLLFEGLGAELPLPTRILLGLSSGVTQYWYLVSLAVAGLGAALFAYVQTDRGRYVWDSLMLRLWPIHLFLRLAIFSRLANMLGMMIKSGVDILQAIDLSSRVVQNRVISDALLRVRDGIKAGGSAAECMRREPIFPSILVQMILAGEESGKIDELLQKIANFYDSELEIMVKNTESLIEPVLIIILAVFVLVLALGIFLPMWGVFSAIQASAG